MGNSSCGVRVVFDLAIDEGPWPGPVAERSATFGEIWVGPMGCLAFLETGLGLGGKFLGAVERAHGVANLLETRDGFWRASFEADAIATSERLLADRDLLVLHGWQGQDLSPRLTALWRATLGAAVGTADRLRAVLAALSTQQVDVESVQLYQETESLPPLWRKVLDALALQNVSIEVLPIAKPVQSGDLLAAQSPGFIPTGDGRLALLGPHGELAAAEAIASSLALMDSLDDVVVIGGDAMLDEALARHGLPRLGLSASPSASHAAVPLVLETAFAPMDPQSLHALLCLDPGPVPRSVAGRLIRALNSMPGRLAPDWQPALDEALGKLPDDSRDKVAARIHTLLMPLVGINEGITLEQLGTRLRCLSTWARGREDSAPTLAALISDCERVLDLASRQGAASFGKADLIELCQRAASGGGKSRAEAGIASVSNPAAIVGPARVIIWWGFTRASAPKPSRVRLTAAECAAMEAQGMTPPDFGAAMAQEAERWQRPLRLATEALILVSPEVDEAGNASHAHPLWDELCCTIADPDVVSKLTCTELRMPALAKRERLSRALLPKACDEIQTKSSLPLRDVESPSSLKGLLGCSLRWALRYHGYMYSGIASGPGEPAPLLYGTIAHYLLAEVFTDGALTGEQAALAAEKLVDRDLIVLCEALGLPRYQDEQGTVRRAIIESARHLGQIMTESGARVGGVEQDVAGTFGDLSISGRADMILRDPDVVIDLKWGAWSNRKNLQSGTALQLAAYAHAAQESGSLPSVAYFILKEQLLLAEPGCPLPDASTPGATTADETWRLALESLATRQKELRAGQLFAPGAHGVDIESSMVEGGLRMDPECGYCELGALCGRGAGR